MSLSTQIALASAIVALTVLLHLIGLGALLAILRRHRPAPRQALAILFDGVAILLAAFGLFALHSAEIWIGPAFLAGWACSATSSRHSISQPRPT